MKIMNKPLPLLKETVRRTLLESAYALSALPISLALFCLIVTGLSAGIGLLVIVGGVLLLSVTAYIARAGAELERRRFRVLLGKRLPSPIYLRASKSDGFWRRWLTPLRDPQSWLDMGWGIIALATATASFCIILSWWAVALNGLTYWFWGRWLAEDDNSSDVASYIGLGDGRLATSLLYLAMGVFATVTMPLLARFAAAIHAGPAGAMLVGRAAWQQRLASAQSSRDATRAAESTALRRLERDIHDGPQQRLVRLGIDLGRARKALENDPSHAGELIDGALKQTRETASELRSLSRGLAPPLLTDRGLAVALREMVAHSAVPVKEQLNVPQSLAAHIETAVYFVVSEALTNVAKHSDAQSATLSVSANTDVELLVRVRDDGRGGAAIIEGHGLAGLRQRLGAVGGELRLISPTGGPTELVARIPLDSDHATVRATATSLSDIDTEEAVVSEQGTA
jgi:signal transduction histidine kinase